MEEDFELGRRGYAKDPRRFNVTEVLNAEAGI
jgi:hypothetical protein